LESAGGSPPRRANTGTIIWQFFTQPPPTLADGLRRLMAAGNRNWTARLITAWSEALYLRDRTTTAWNCIGIVRRKSGRAIRPANWPMVHAGIGFWRAVKEAPRGLKFTLANLSAVNRIAQTERRLQAAGV